MGKMDEKGRKLNNNARLGIYQKLSDSQGKISLEYLSKVFRNLWIIGYFCFVFSFHLSSFTPAGMSVAITLSLVLNVQNMYYG